jgi:hypothetical protein
MAVTLAYLLFLPIAALCFWRLSCRTAILVTAIGGWLLLPVAHYPRLAEGSDLAWWIVGIALPSDMLVTKAWIAPVVALIGGAICDRAAIKAWRAAAIDAPMAMWCVWPLMAGLVAGGGDPPPPIAALYVTGAWGVPWLIGRVWFADREGGLLLTRGLALSGLALMPIAVIETVRPPLLYGLFYGPHPFRFDGIYRYVGYRPLGFMEDGNLYGLWATIGALAAIWVARRPAEPDEKRFWFIVAAVTTGVAIAAQSVGALVLLAIGVAVMLLWNVAIVLPALAAMAIGVLALAAVHFSGVVPLRTLAAGAVGQQTIGTLRAVGRQSFAWRVSQDIKTLPGATAAPIAGSSRWDWWRRFGTRPWGQPLLIIGQYGLIGLALAWGSLALAAAAGLVRYRRWGDRVDDGTVVPLALVVLLTLADALLNAFFFSAAILAAGAIAAHPGRNRGTRRPHVGRVAD